MINKLTKKILVIVVVSILVISVGFVFYDLNTGNEMIKRNYNKLTGQPCELKYMPNGWTQIQNCNLYKYHPKGLVR